MVDRVERGDRAVVEVAAVGALLAFLFVDPAFGRQERDGRAVGREAPLDADAVRDVLHGIVGGRLVRDAAVPGRTRALAAVAAQRPRLGVVDLHVELRIVVERLSGLRIESFRPVQVVDVLPASEELAVGAIDRVVEPVAREVADDLPASAVDRRVVQHVDADFVEVPRIVRGVLEVPGQRTCVDVHRHHGVRVQIVAGTRLRIVDRHRVARAPDRELRRRIVRAGLPEATAAGLPRVVLVLPGLAARIARLRHDVPAPELLARTRVERRDPSAGLRVAGSVGHDHFAVGGDRRRVESFLAAEFVGRRHHLVPHDLAGVAVRRNHTAVGQIGDHEILPERDAARARQVALVLHARVRHPGEFALVRIPSVDLVERAPAVARVEEAVVDERMHFGLGAVLPDVLHAAERHRPDQPQVLHVLAVDLRQLRVARRRVIAVHHQPVLRLVLRIDQPILVDRHAVLAGERDCRERRRRKGREGRQLIAFHGANCSSAWQFGNLAIRESGNWIIW